MKMESDLGGDPHLCQVGRADTGHLSLGQIGHVAVVDVEGKVLAVLVEGEHFLLRVRIHEREQGALDDLDGLDTVLTGVQLAFEIHLNQQRTR